VNTLRHLVALVALTVLAFTELAAFGAAIVTGHFEPCFLSGKGSKWQWVPTLPLAQA
jgi:hypothetical protein